MTVLAVLQPSYLPWIGFFDQLRRCDIFVFYDDVPFDKHGWRNRNRIKTAQGATWLTVPVRHRGRAGQLINEVEIDSAKLWARKHLQTVEQAYARAPHRDRYLSQLADVLRRDWSRLAALDIAASKLMSGWFDIERPMYLSSDLGIGGDRNSRLLNICKHFAARTYLSGAAAREYLDVALFERHDIHVEWQDFDHPQYPQLHGDFIPYLSALDCVLNMGPDCRLVLETGHGS